ncbi:LysR family transcriptional regulator [Hominifimenecus sp. rT4P-3]|uniref:LysR family transcriptional regulator n=1 Tax=Hominifimenecus sp. rT4P-3 TaxID=3242979 RepID=UPI003DA2FE04
MARRDEGPDPKENILPGEMRLPERPIRGKFWYDYISYGSPILSGFIFMTGIFLFYLFWKGLSIPPEFLNLIGGNFMELRVLNYFLAIAREENFTRAAEQLHVTQPTLSRQIAQLEEELGVELFVRSNHNIILTEDGMILKRRAQEILSLADKTKRDFLHKDENLEGVISIGSGEFLATRYLTDCIAEFRKKHPLVRYEFYSGNADNIRDYIERGFLDIGLMSEPIDIRKYEFVSMPMKEEWGALVQKDSPLAEKSVITPQDLVDIPIISALGEFIESDIGKWFGEYAGQVNIVAKGNLLYNEAMLAESGIGAVIGIRLNYNYNNLRFIPLSPALKSGTALAWKKEQIFSTVTSTFIDFLKKYSKGITCDKR